MYLDIPPTADILAVAKERADTATQHGDVSGAAQLNRVRVNLSKGAQLSWDQGDLMIQSVNNPGSVYAVNVRGCSCPNGAAGRQTCWHVGLFGLLEEMAEDRAVLADLLADAAAYREEEDEEGDDSPPTPITLTHTPDGLVLTHGSSSSLARDASDLATAIAALTARPVATPQQLGSRLAQARQRSQLAA